MLCHWLRHLSSSDGTTCCVKHKNLCSPPCQAGHNSCQSKLILILTVGQKADSVYLHETRSQLWCKPIKRPDRGYLFKTYLLLSRKQKFLKCQHVSISTTTTATTFTADCKSLSFQTFTTSSQSLFVKRSYLLLDYISELRLKNVSSQENQIRSLWMLKNSGELEIILCWSITMSNLSSESCSTGRKLPINLIKLSSFGHPEYLKKDFQ